jgi:uncharacterized membrane protein YgaE (UPF0421/DUF939 family)
MENVLTGMPLKTIAKRNLADIELEEVSLVNKADNKKKFLFFKSASAASDGPCLDLLDIIEQVEKNYTLSDEENDYIEKAIKTLSILESEDVDALSNVILLLSELIGGSEQSKEVQKMSSDIWPSITERPRMKKIDTDDKTKWPSLCESMVTAEQ